MTWEFFDNDTFLQGQIIKIPNQKKGGGGVNDWGKNVIISQLDNLLTLKTSRFHTYEYN